MSSIYSMYRQIPSRSLQN